MAIFFHHGMNGMLSSGIGDPDADNPALREIMLHIVSQTMGLKVEPVRA